MYYKLKFYGTAKPVENLPIVNLQTPATIGTAIGSVDFQLVRVKEIAHIVDADGNQVGHTVLYVEAINY